MTANQTAKAILATVVMLIAAGAIVYYLRPVAQTVRSTTVPAPEFDPATIKAKHMNVRALLKLIPATMADIGIEQAKVRQAETESTSAQAKLGELWADFEAGRISADELGQRSMATYRAYRDNLKQWLDDEQQKQLVTTIRSIRGTAREILISSRIVIDQLKLPPDRQAKIDEVFRKAEQTIAALPTTPAPESLGAMPDEAKAVFTDTREQLQQILTPDEVQKAGDLLPLLGND
jgi:hypothetical protein